MSRYILPAWKIPKLVTRPWRLVPELDEFDDDRSEAFVRDIQRLRMAGLLIAFPIALVLGMGLTLTGAQIADGFPRSAWVNREAAAGRLAGVLFGIAIIGVVTSLAFTPYMLIIRRALRRHIARARCPACSYSLLGLPLVEVRSDDDWDPGEDTVRCPECGCQISLAAHGLRPEDILAGAMLPNPRTAARTRERSKLTTPLLAAAFLALGGWIISGADGWLTAFLVILVAVGMVAGNQLDRKLVRHADVK